MEEGGRRGGWAGEVADEACVILWGLSMVDTVLEAEKRTKIYALSMVWVGGFCAACASMQAEAAEGRARVTRGVENFMMGVMDGEAMESREDGYGYEMREKNVRVLMMGSRPIYVLTG